MEITLGALSSYADSLLSNYLMTSAATTRPTAWYLALHTANPTANGSAGELGTGIGYARQSATFTSTSGVSTNTALITFGPDTTSNWGTIGYLSIFDAVTGGNCLWQGALTSSTTININDKVEIPANGLTLTIS